MFKKTLAVLAVLTIFAGGIAIAADEVTPEEVQQLKDKVKDLEKRVMKNERKTALDKIDFSGDFRVQAHSWSADIPDHFDGMHLQNLMVNTMFWMGANQSPYPPADIGDLDTFIAQNYGDYLHFTDNLTFEDLQMAMAGMSPEQVQGLMQYLMPHTYQPGYDADNSLMYTSRLRLQIDADVYKNVDFSGRLGMYKVWGDSTGVQTFAGQSSQINIDGTTVGVPNSDILRVERAYFTWKDIADMPMYLSIGRRPSTGGVPLNFREDEPRGGTPMGSLINFQFDGITLGYHIGEHSTARLCYGVGYESGFGNASELVLPQDRLDDAIFLGINWDIWHDDDMLVQATIARAFDVTDGFNGLVVLPNNPVTGAEIGAPVIMRFTPSSNLGDIDLASVVITRTDGPFDWFASFNYMESSPNNVTTPFGGLFSDPFEAPQDQDGYMYYFGARYTLPNGATKIGLEYNHGSQYWFNFAVAEDDLLAAKTAARGDVIEAYLTHRINKHFVFKFNYISYDYDYSGSGWHMGTPKELDGAMAPVLGFPTYSSIDKFMLGLTARF